MEKECLENWGLIRNHEVVMNGLNGLGRGASQRLMRYIRWYFSCRPVGDFPFRWMKDFEKPENLTAAGGY